jgi:hypothetical protein
MMPPETGAYVNRGNHLHTTSKQDPRNLPWKSSSAVGIYSTSAGLESTFIELRLAGFPVEDISILFSSGKSTAAPAREAPPAKGETDEIMRRGCAVAPAPSRDESVQRTLRWLIDAGAQVALSEGSIIAAGPFAVALAGVDLDGRAGDVASTLVRHGIQEREASYCERRVRNGGVLVSVNQTYSESARFAGLLMERTGAEQVWTTDEAT